MQPSGLEIAAAQRSNVEKAATREKRLQRRRDTYKRKQSTTKKVPIDEEDDSDLDSVDDPEQEDDQNKGIDEEPEPGPSGVKSRADVIRDLMGDVSDITSSTGSSNVGNEPANVSYNVSGVSNYRCCLYFTNENCSNVY